MAKYVTKRYMARYTDDMEIFEINEEALRTELKAKNLSFVDVFNITACEGYTYVICEVQDIVKSAEPYIGFNQNKGPLL